MYCVIPIFGYRRQHHICQYFLYMSSLFEGSVAAREEKRYFLFPASRETGKEERAGEAGAGGGAERGEGSRP